VIVPEQAEAIRWAADALLSGWSLTNIGAELRRRGHRGARGGALGPSAIRQMLTSPTIAGLRQHRGEIVGRGCWESIIGEDTRQMVKAKLSGPRVVQQAPDRPDGRRHGGPRDGGEYLVTPSRLGQRNPRKYVLTGLAVCSLCSAPMGGTVKTTPSGRRSAYLVCAPGRGGRSCVGILAEPTETYVVDRLFAELDRPEFLAAVAADDHAERRDGLARALSALDAQRAELAGMWAAGGMSTMEWRAARAGLDVRENELRAELAAMPAPPARLDGIAGAREAWPAMKLDERRELLRMFIEAVLISRAKPGARAFDSNRISIEWRRI
jgi:hypothetical protein